jgi:hypothetical protein
LAKASVPIAAVLRIPPNIKEITRVKIKKLRTLVLLSQYSFMFYHLLSPSIYDLRYGSFFVSYDGI